MKSYLLFGLTALVAGCDGSSDAIAGPNCADVGVPAITLIALDARSRQTITSRALVIARDGPYADTADGVGSPPLYVMAYNRPGTYSVTLELAGYEPWRIDGVVAPRGQCNVMLVPLAALLFSSGSASAQDRAR
ncbi:MAG TPA: hypothetical protein VIP11_03245 [Gemmatimonadaceae bacterium]